MLDIFTFIFSQFYNAIMVLDEIVIYESLTLLKVLIIVFIFSFSIKFLFNKEKE